MTCCNVLVAAYAFISCAAAFKVAKVEPKEVHVKLGEPFGFICTADNWYEWCAFKHLEKRCEIEWKRTPYNVTMGHCDFEGRVNFKGDYNNYECGLTVAAATAEDHGEWECDFESYVKGGSRGDGYKAAKKFRVVVDEVAGSNVANTIHREGAFIVPGRNFLSEKLYDLMTKILFHHQDFWIPLFGSDQDELITHTMLSAKAKMVFDDLDRNQDGGLEISEVSLENLLRPPFLRSVSKIIFDLVIHVNQGFNSTSINFVEFVDATRGLAVPKELLATFPAFDRNMDGEVTLEEVEQVVLLLSCRVRDIQISTWLGLINAHWKGYPRGRDWLVGLPDNKMMGLTMLYLYLAPFLVTLPRSFFASLLTATDIDKDGRMTWAELEQLSDFHLVETNWVALLEQSKNDQLEAIALGELLDVPIKPDEIFRKITKPSSLLHLFNALVYDEYDMPARIYDEVQDETFPCPS